MDDIISQVFPQNEIEALAMLYVQHQDLTDLTPEELVKMYDNAYETIAEIRRKQDYEKREWF